MSVRTEHLSRIALKIVAATAAVLSLNEKDIKALRQQVMSKTRNQQVALSNLYFELEAIYDDQLKVALHLALNELVKADTGLAEMTLRVLASRTFKVCRTSRVKAIRWSDNTFKVGESFATQGRKAAAKQPKAKPVRIKAAARKHITALEALGYNVKLTYAPKA